MKKIVSLLIILSVILGMMPIFAETAVEEVNVNLASGDITINGTDIDNSKEAFPFVSYKDITYFPMTWDFAQSMGLSTSWTPETGLKINKSGSGEAVKLTPTADNDLSKSYKASVSSSRIEVEGSVVDNATEEFPVLTFRDITYFPMTWRFMVEEFGTDYSWNAETGLNISSSAEMTTDVVVEVEDGEPVNVPEKFNVLDDGTIIVEATFDGDYLRENMYGISDYIGVIEAGTERQSLVLENKNTDWHGYFYDLVVSFYDDSDELIYDYNATHGAVYKSDGTYTRESKVGLFGATEDYNKLKITMKLYSPELFKEMNDEITSSIEVEYIQPGDVSKSKFISDGGHYILGNGLYTQELSNPDLSAYSALHNGEKMVLSNGSIVRYEGGELKPNKETYYKISDFDIIENVDHRLNLTIVVEEGTMRGFGTNGESILMFDKNYKPIKIYINLDEFEGSN